MQAPSRSLEPPNLQNQFLRSLFEATTDFVFVKNLTGRYVAINQAAAEAIGMDPVHVVGKSDHELFPPAIADRWAAEDRAVLALGGPLTFEDQFDAGGKRIQLQTVKSLWRNEEGEVIGIVGIGRDLTEARRVQQALKEVESRYQKLFASDLMGIHIPDRFGAITEANDEFLRITGYTRKDLEAGQVRWDTMTPPEFHALDMTHIAEAARRGTCTPYEKQYIRKDGTRVPIMCGYTLLEGSEDQYIAFIQDMTAVKRSEVAMRQAEKLNMAGRFAASMAHEINNPLAAVTNLIFLALQNQELPKSTHNLLSMADRELARISRVVAQTLRFHKQSTAPVLADVREVMNSVFPLFSSRIRHEAAIVTQDYSDVALIWCFNHEIRHAFANLIGNALDAVQTEGAVSVRIREGCVRKSSPKRGILITVADNGNGIPLEVRSRIFEPFFSTKEKTGTGLGLWATESIVRRHGGRIIYRTSTRPGLHGTVFSIFLPFDAINPEVPGQAGMRS